ncbi:beta-glucanase (GH16 family) [Allocatelliglobosispora scoriae]|uniref:Beta-glucanase (GH16 family) n=1 Tax=Allocatelliglobosispora scoriae TaxID=643052 RepID=A0A841BQ43_9ACTN|nr:discoidin domain-containing protein [Allocatelliglobosispora scoriae]MBB5869063.1 beta-glucanase (GH16 family) [Allocatelliglobosispora scoriae]
MRSPVPHGFLPSWRALSGATRLWVSFVVLAVTAAGLTLVARPATADLVLLSQGKPATASSVEAVGTPASAAVDGNTGTRWASAFSDPQWIQVDLGASSAISQVVLNWEPAYATGFRIEVSTNGTTWTPIYTTTTGTGGIQTLAVTGTGRYVRMYGTARATAYGYSLWEFQVFGGSTPPACGTANVAQGKEATASSVENAGTPAASAVDGNVGTRWSSAYTVPQWIQIDLGSTQQVCQVVLVWEAAYATAFQVQLSSNATAWTSIYSTTTGTGGTQTLDVSGTGRYLRVYITAKATQWGASLWEIQVRTGTVVTSPSSSPSTQPSPSTSTPPTGGDVLLSYNKPGTASTSQDDGACPGCVPAKAFDRDPGTRWATSATTGWVDPGWIYVDLGATAQIHKVILQWDPAYATAYQIQTSTNATTWTTIYSTTTSTGFKQTLTGLTGTGRYVRMYGTARSSTYGYSLWEFQVWGTGGAPITPPALPPAPGNPLVLKWSDEFNAGNGAAPDNAKWRPEVGPGVNNELQYYTNNANAYHDGGGNLVLEAKRQVTPGSACPGGECQYTSARLNTSQTYTFAYGRAEARIKVTGTQGLWPAFWLLGANFFQGTPWPNCGEIDIMEHVGKVANATYGTIHAPAYNGAGGIGSPYTIAGDFASDFHVFRVDWDAMHIAFSVDGNQFYSIDKEQTELTKGPWVYDHPFFIILNNAVGGDWPGAPDATTVLPQKMLVDYVRVYQ